MVGRVFAMDLEIVSAMRTPGSGGAFSQITLSKSNLSGPWGIWGQRRNRMSQSWMAGFVAATLAWPLVAKDAWLRFFFSWNIAIDSESNASAKGITC